jgi:hypothetical protein
VCADLKRAYFGTRSVWAGALVTTNRDSATTLGFVGAAESRSAWARTAVSMLAAAITVTRSATPVMRPRISF